MTSPSPHFYGERVGVRGSIRVERGCVWATEARGIERGCVWATEARGKVP
jgi:hypothetical protein